MSAIKLIKKNGTNFKLYNSNNELESTFEVGLFPGDFAYWEFEEN